MKSMLMMVPYDVLSSTVDFGLYTNPGNMFTPDPKEVATLNGGSADRIKLDLGSPKIVDTVFIGFNALSPVAYISGVEVSNDFSFASSTYIYSGAPGDISVAPIASGPRVQHGVALGTPALGRYVRINISNNGPTAAVAVMAVGRRFQPQWGHEMGAGRAVEDISNVERLFGGGFGIDPATPAPNWQWTLGDLQNAEVQRLYQALLKAGRGKTILVVEDPDFAPTPLSVPIGTGTISNGGLTVTKGGAASGYDAGAYTAARGGGMVISGKIASAGGGHVQTAAFIDAPTSNPGGANYKFGVNMGAGTTALWYNGASIGIIDGAADGDRFALVYDEQYFMSYRNGVLNAVRPALVSSPQYMAQIGLYAQNDAVSEFFFGEAAMEERIHWGVLDKVDFYERRDPANTRWGFTIRDWA